DPAIGTNRQDMIAKLDGALDMPFDGQVLAAVELAFDDNRLPYIHDDLLHLTASLCWTRNRSPGLNRRGRLGCSRGLSACWSDCFIAFPHEFLRLSAYQGARVSAVVRCGGPESRSV